MSNIRILLIGEQKEIEKVIQTLPITLIEANKELTREAARIKDTKRMTYAGCFAIALSCLRKAELYTGDSGLKWWKKTLRWFGFNQNRKRKYSFSLNN